MMRSLLRTAAAITIACFAACRSEPSDGAHARTRGADADERGDRGEVVVDASHGPRPSAAAPASAPLSFDDARPAAKLALLVGIDRYAPGTPDAFQKLQGCVRDVARVRDILIHRFGFAPADILVLENERATHENIVRAFRGWLIERSTADTEVLFWYSGHGSRVPDRSGVKRAEQGEKDSTLVAYDSRANGENGAYDVSDDEVRSLLHALTRKTSRVTVVTDSCHSGGVTRGAPDRPVRVRAIDEGVRPVDLARLRDSFWPADVPLSDEDAGIEVEPDRWVHIAACASTQTAQEIDTLDGNGNVEAHGALTFFLTQCLETAQPHTSYRDLADDTAVRLSSRVPSQNVSREGALERQVFGARFDARPAGFLARVLPEGEILVEAGSFHGLRRDSVVALLDPRANANVGRARVVRAGALSSYARWLDPAPAAPPVGALRAVEETRPDRLEPLGVFVADRELAPFFASSERVRVETEDPRRADYRLAIDPEDDTLTLYAPGELKIWKHARPGRVRDPAIAVALEDTFREELRYQNIVGLAEMGGTIPLEAEFVSPTPEKIARYSENRRVRDAHPARSAGGRAEREFESIGTLDPKDEVSLAVLQVKNPTDRDVYLWVFSASEDRARNLIWPPIAGMRDNVLRAGETLDIDVNLISHPKWPHSRPMRDRYLVIATRAWGDLSPLTYPAELRSGGSNPLVMPALLATAIEKSLDRGATSVGADRTSFGITVIDMWVRRPDAP